MFPVRMVYSAIRLEHEDPDSYLDTECKGNINEVSKMRLNVVSRNGVSEILTAKEETDVNPYIAGRIDRATCFVRHSRAHLCTNGQR